MNRWGAPVPVTMHDVARAAGVSVKTVSNVLNDYPYIRPETRLRVQDAIKQLDYRVNAAARSLRAGRSNTLTLAIPELTQPYFAELAQSVIDESAMVGLNVFVETTGGRLERERDILVGDRPVLVDGVIFSPAEMSSGVPADVSPRVPMVLLGERTFDTGFDHVVIADVSAAEAAVAHLMDLGRRRVVIIGASLDDRSSWTGTLRLQGAMNAHRERRVEVDPRLVFAPPAWDWEHGEAVIRELLETGTSFDAVFAMNDALAIGALVELRHHGRAVPGDVAVIGFDDTAQARYSSPTLSSIAPGRAEIAQLAVRLLAGRLDGTRPTEERLELTASFTLVARESTLG